MATYTGLMATVLIVPDDPCKHRETLRVSHYEVISEQGVGNGGPVGYYLSTDVTIKATLTSPAKPPDITLAKELAKAVLEDDVVAVRGLIDWVYENLAEFAAKKELSREELIKKMLDEEYKRGVADGEGSLIDDNEPYDPDSYEADDL
jgi:hypothetical protein